MATCKTWSFCEDPASGFTALLLCDDKMKRCRVIYDAVKPSKGSLPNVEYDQSVTELWKRLGPTIAKYWSAIQRIDWITMELLRRHYVEMQSDPMAVLRAANNVA